MKIVSDSLNLSIGFKRTLGMSFIVFVLICFVAELFARTEIARHYLAPPSLGSQHRQFEIQIDRLQRFVEYRGQVDCIFVGSSMVWLGINPEVFSETYEIETGEAIRCFNAGISAMPASGAGALARILVEDYHPKILIFGTSARDYVISRSDEYAAVVLDTPWVRYRSGHFAVAGWLTDRLYIYRNLKNLHDLLRFDNRVFQTDNNLSSYASHGFLAKTRQPKAAYLEAAKRENVKWLHNYEILPENLDGLEEVVRQREQGVRVIVAEMPVARSYFGYFKNGEYDFETFTKRVGDLLQLRSIPFLQTTDLQLIPDDGWWDENHLNLNGANLLSAWLGEQIGRIVKAEAMSVVAQK